MKFGNRCNSMVRTAGAPVTVQTCGLVSSSYSRPTSKPFGVGVKINGGNIPARESFGGIIDI